MPPLLTLAVVTAQVASSFVGQDSSRDKPAKQGERPGRAVTVARLDQRLARIESLLAAAHTGDSPSALDVD